MGQPVRRHRLSIVVFVLGVVLSIVVNLATDVLPQSWTWARNGWALGLILLSLTVAGAWLIWRQESATADDASPTFSAGASTGTVIQTAVAHGPIIGSVGGSVTLGPPPSPSAPPADPPSVPPADPSPPSVPPAGPAETGGGNDPGPHDG